ncbi:MAG TPA: macrolide ABC transporter ATP-binding protein [Deltaproteobacteria bacterium]|nr:MAG: macrolide ABC transporter ATP-binding protein [Deltaproteobacteria bacterium RIFOXYA2_FULL_55_11]HBA38306.1 macrolide ABC transporter ATP-binding protein [Deltaproteobacteria bacterium]
MIRLINVHKIYQQGRNKITALAGLSLDIQKGEFAAVMGPSGSGKSTLLHLIGGLDRPTEGQVLVDGRIISQMVDDEATLFRRTRIGFVFQFFNLLPTLAAVENVMLPLILDGRSGSESNLRAKTLLERVGLEGRRDHLPEELSGGEMQRLAIARALAFNPPILLADEPTGNLDSKNGAAVLELLRQINTEQRCTVVMVTHNQEAAGYGDRIVHLRDGMIEEENPR